MKAELVLIPAHARGHFASALEFAKLAVTRSDNLSITVLIMKFPINPNSADYFDSLVASFAPMSERLKFIDISPPSIDDFLDGGLFLFLKRFYKRMKQRAKSAIEGSVAASRLAGFVIDMSCMAMADLADEIGVPTYVFWPSSSGSLSLIIDLLGSQQTERKYSDKKRDSLFFPCFVNPVPTAVLPTVVSDATFAETITRMRETKGIIVNTSAELEPHALHAWISGGVSPPVYHVGPAVSLITEGDQSGGASNIMEWLDGQPPSSVLFLCFGSVGSFGREQVREIAKALERTGFRFLWTLRRLSPEVGLTTEYADPATVLPDGFLDRTAEVGRVIGWAPQTAVLSHEAVGGFVSHCGWNSVLESVWFGVPVAAWPMHSEQQLNAFQLVAELGLAVEIKMDHKVGFETGVHEDEAVVVSAAEIETGMIRVMESESDVRKRVKEMSVQCRKGVVEGGSSHSSLGCFVTDVFSNFSDN